MQPGLSGNPFCGWKSKVKKDWERKTEKAALINLFEVIKINQQSDSNYNPIPTPRFETVFIK